MDALLITLVRIPPRGRGNDYLSQSGRPSLSTQHSRSVMESTHSRDAIDDEYGWDATHNDENRRHRRLLMRGLWRRGYMYAMPTPIDLRRVVCLTCRFQRRHWFGRDLCFGAFDVNKRGTFTMGSQYIGIASKPDPLLHSDC